MVDFELVDYLLAKILERTPTHNAIIIGSKDNWRGLPSSKSLFCSKPGIGLPIGDLTSQLFSNIYLNKLDQYCKRQLKCKHYGRYVDDFYIIETDLNRLREIIPLIRDFLYSTLQSILHPNKISITSCYKGVPFLGGYILPFRIVPGHRVIANFLRLAYSVKRNSNRYLAEDKICDYFNSMNSYLGFLGHYSSYKLRRKTLNKKGMFTYYYFDKSFSKLMLKAISFKKNSDFQI